MLGGKERRARRRGCRPPGTAPRRAHASSPLSSVSRAFNSSIVERRSSRSFRSCAGGGVESARTRGRESAGVERLVRDRRRSTRPRGGRRRRGHTGQGREGIDTRRRATRVFVFLSQRLDVDARRRAHVAFDVVHGVGRPLRLLVEADEDCAGGAATSSTTRRRRERARANRDKQRTDTCGRTHHSGRRPPPFVSASMTPDFSRYLRNSSFLLSGVCGGARRVFFGVDFARGLFESAVSSSRRRRRTWYAIGEVERRGDGGAGNACLQHEDEQKLKVNPLLWQLHDGRTQSTATAFINANPWASSSRATRATSGAR